MAAHRAVAKTRRRIMARIKPPSRRRAQIDASDAALLDHLTGLAGRGADVGARTAIDARAERAAADRADEAGVGGLLRGALVEDEEAGAAGVGIEQRAV